MTRDRDMSPRRTLLIALALMTLCPLKARAQQSMSADEAVSRALKTPQVQELLQARILFERATLEESLVRPVPTLSLSYAQVPGQSLGGSLEFQAVANQTVDLTGWRARLRQTLAAREDAQRASTQSWRLRVSAEVRHAFFEALYLQERVRALEDWIARLERGVQIIAARQARGDASPYDVQRMQREVTLARQQRAASLAQLAQARSSLRAWVPWTQAPRLAGSLTPPSPPPQGQRVLPEILQLQRLQSSLSAELDAWQRPFLRNWNVGGGYRFVREDGGQGHGFILSLTVPIALWNTDLARRDRLQAERARLGHEVELASTLAAQAEVAALQRQHDALAALALAPGPQERDLTTMAEVSYGADEATLTELLDAYRSETELLLSTLDLQWEARKAALELERRRGVGATP